MKKLALTIVVGLVLCSAVRGASLKVTASASATVDKVEENGGNGLLFKFDLPKDLLGARIDLAYLHFKVETDSTQPALGLLVKPMLESWTSGTKLSSLSDSTVLPNHVNYGRLNLKDGTGKVEITQAVKAWQSGELQNFGILVYPVEAEAATLKPSTLPMGGAAELEIFYTALEVKK